MSPEHIRLTEALRELRARSGLSLAALAGRTAFSKSSWERYLNGKSLPPREAVRELCRIAGEPDGRLLALWEIAESEWSGRAASSAPARTASARFPAAPAAAPSAVRAPDERAAGTGRRRDRRARLLVVLVSAYAVLAGTAALALLLLPDRHGPEDGAEAAVPYSVGPTCHGAACEGEDPIRMICGVGPDTLSTRRTDTGAHVELRYSRKCGASWARIWGTRIGDRVRITAAGRSHEGRVGSEDDTTTYVYTPMVTARPGTALRACFLPASDTGGRTCVEAVVGASPTASPAALSRPRPSATARRSASGPPRSPSRSGCCARRPV
ncbi:MULTISPECIES: XRE family transcriptional regulator [unclassified Streptomyces]|uniref:helix-turn-helix domain-containing protein n=1 Tax=unclassified Streptomyces TaxID=2593676 RepID=UPI000F710EEE|nr:MULTISPECIES: XRE family transcriptional regulator [unclassified Streptomyces]AZM60794.1 XRE family transcriptional regulator [Streptomyces sp. WAC 01438]RSM96985.1 XRE family transcriptional regulator [Streptomyces sp. WAC 01420]